MKMLRRVPQLLRFIPGTAQDVRAYFLTLQYWLAGSEENVANMVHFLVDRYADGPRRGLRGRGKYRAPVQYPEVGVYHPRLAARMADDAAALPGVARAGARGTVGLLLMRSYLLAGNSGHYDGVIAALEARGLSVIPAFATGLDARPAVERFFLRDGQPLIDALVSLTGFSLVGGPAYNDARAAEEILARLDVPYLAVTPVEFQTIQQWGGSERGLLPVESTMMVAIPELDGSTGPMVYGGRANATGTRCAGCHEGCRFAGGDQGHDMRICSERADALARRVAKLVDLRRSERAERKIAAVIFNFPPNAGNTGTAAILSVFESLHNTLRRDEARGLYGGGARPPSTHCANASSPAMRRASVPPPTCARAFPPTTTCGASGGSRRSRRSGDPPRVVSKATAVRSSCWASASAMCSSPFSPPSATKAIRCGCCSNGASHRRTRSRPSIAICARTSVPMRCCTSAPMARSNSCPASKSGMSGACWPDRLIGDLPNLYLYASNNPSEGTIAKRRAAATLVSYLTPPVAQAGLYRGLVDLKASIERWRTLPPETRHERDPLAALIQAQAAELDLAPAEPAWTVEADTAIERLGRSRARARVHAHPAWSARSGSAAVAGRARRHAPVGGGSISRRAPRARRDRGPGGGTLARRRGSRRRHRSRRHDARGIGRARRDRSPAVARITRSPASCARSTGASCARHRAATCCARPRSCPPDAICTASIRSAFPAPSRCRTARGRPNACSTRHVADGHSFPESIALVLWGTDNLKSEGGPIAPGAGAARRASRGSTATAASPAPTLIPLGELGRPRVDVVDDAVRHLPRPAAAADQAAGRSGLPRRRRRRAGRAELRAQARARLPGGSTAATSRRRRCACSAMPTAPTARTSIIWSTAAAGTTRTSSPRPTPAARASPTAAPGRPVQQTALLQSVLAGRRARLPESRFGRARRHHHRHLLRHAGRHQPRRAPRAGRRRRRRSTSAIRPAATAPCARSPSRSRSRRARAC